MKESEDSRQKVSFLFRTKEFSLWSILRLFFQGQGGNFKLIPLEARLCTLTRLSGTRRTTTDTRSRDDKALSRVTIANRKDVLYMQLLSSPGRKVRKLDSSNLQFRRVRCPANYIHITQINPLVEVQIRSGD